VVIVGYVCDIPKKFCSAREENGTCKLKIRCEPVIEKCKGCEKVENNYCKTYIVPKNKWSVNKVCPVATHIETAEQKTKRRIRIGQQKHK
jgi:hypothetical protein